MDLARIALLLLGAFVFLVITQDIHIFPGAFFSKAQFLSQRNKAVPRQVESLFIKAADGAELEVWRYAPDRRTGLSGYAAVVFHGNGGAVEDFVFVQMWLAELGIPSYGFDYRGFGRSSGWPSERGINRDGDAVWEYAVRRENSEPSRMILVGISIGSAPAARIAALHQPRLLLLCSAFTDLKSAARAQPVIGLLAPLVWHRFPTLEYVRRLETTDLLLAHGLRDNIVPADHSIRRERAYRGSGRV